MKRLLNHLDYPIILAAIAFVMLAMLGVTARGAIPGFRVGINWTGYDPTGQPGGPAGTPYTYEPIDGSTGFLKQQYVDAVAKYVAPVIGRDMDWKYLNDSTISTWAQQQALGSDYTAYGMRETTDINAANQMRAKVPDFTPQIGIPLMADDDYAYQQGKLWAQRFSGKASGVSINLGNEVWSVYAGNLGAWNLNQAHAEGYVGDDFRILGLRQGVRLAQKSLKFRQGWQDGGGDPSKVSTIIEGFAPIPQYIQNQVDGMKSIGADPKTLNAKLSIAEYAAGSASDLQGLLGTAAQKEVAVDAFINAGPAVWTAQTLAIAKANGLDPHVRAYEFRLATKPVSGAEIADWVAFQNTDNAMRIQQEGIPTLLNAAGGVGAVFNVEGFGGFPMNAPQGQFPLVDINQMFTDPFQSGVFRGVNGLIDFSSIPQTPAPASFALCTAIALLSLAGRRERRMA